MYTYEKNVMIYCLREACLCYFFMLIFCLLKDLFYCSLFYWFILIFGHMMHWCICKLGTFINVIAVMILVLLIKKWSVYYKNAFLSFITMQIARKISTNNKIIIITLDIMHIIVLIWPLGFLESPTLKLGQSSVRVRACYHSQTCPVFADRNKCKSTQGNL